MNFLQTVECDFFGPYNAVCVKENGGGAECSAGTCDAPGGKCVGAFAVNCYANRAIDDETGKVTGMAWGGDCSDLGGCVYPAWTEASPFDPNTQSTAGCATWEAVAEDACASDLTLSMCRAIDPAFSCWQDPGEPCGVSTDQRECDLGQADCNGAVARSCIGGKWFDFDCGAFADATCEPFEGHVRCTSAAWKAYVAGLQSAVR